MSSRRASSAPACRARASGQNVNSRRPSTLTRRRRGSRLDPDDVALHLPLRIRGGYRYILTATRVGRCPAASSGRVEPHANGAALGANAQNLGGEGAYTPLMREELLIDLRRTQLLAVDSNLDDARRALLRAARIPTVFAAELRTIHAAVAELERRVLASTKS